MKAPCARAASTSAGYTLIELLAVLVIMGIVATLALPQAEPVAAVRADAAAREVAQAVRFAQAEAQRTGVNYMARCDLAAGTMALTRLDTTVTPPAPDLSVPVLHPIDKKDYRIVFSASQPTTGAAITTCAFTYSDGKTVPQLTFGDDGAPVNLVGPKGPDIKALTGFGQIVVAAGRVRRTVLVSAPSGRVTIVPSP
jgi:prepilin-type N-terminal cleavage/methylation domain-containing protein